MWEGSHSEQHIAEEIEENCRMCLDRKRPLLKLCRCTGSIGYVHEDCILKWFAAKLEKAEPLALPRCELCQHSYSAELKRARRQLSGSQLMQKVASKTRQQIFTILLLVVAYAMIPWIMANGIMQVVEGEVEDGVSWFFSKFVFPMVFAWGMRERWQGWRKEVGECYVQLVEILLLPQQILR